MFNHIGVRIRTVMMPSIKTQIVTRFTVNFCLYKNIPKITPERMLFRVKPGKNGPLGLTMYCIISEIPPTTPPTSGPYKRPVMAKAKKLNDISNILENTNLKKSIITAAAIRKSEPLHSDIASGHKSTLLVQLGNIAQRVGRSLNIDNQNGRIMYDNEAMKYWSRSYEPGWEMKL